MRSFMMTLLLSLVLLQPFSLANSYTGNVNFKEVQLDNLKYAYDVGVQSDIDLEDIGYIFSALVWQESSAGTITGEGKSGHKAYGIFQNYLPTVKSRLKQRGLTYSDQNVINMLKDRHFSAIFAEMELSYWLEWHKGDIFKSLASYNAGYKWQRSKGYANEVLRKANHLKKYDNNFLNTDQEGES